MELSMFLVTLSLFLFSRYPLGVRADICGKYAVLTEIDRFYVSQPFTHQMPIDFKNYIETFSNMESHLQRFEKIASNYSTLEALEAREPVTLIPFTPRLNVIKINVPQQDIQEECSRLNAQLLQLEPREIPKIIEILKAENMNMTPFFTLPYQKAIYSPNFKQLHRPTMAKGVLETAFTTIANVMPPYLQLDGSIRYPVGDVNASETVMPALCSKPNNYWDRPLFRSNFIGTIQTIINSLKTVKNLGEVVSKLPTQFNLLSKSPSPLLTGAYKLAIPLIVSKIRTFFQKYNNVEGWENTSPTDFKDFIEFKNNLKTLKQDFKINNKVTSNGVFSDFMFNNKSINLPHVDEDRMLTFLGMDPDQFGLCGPVQIVPLLSTPATSNIATSLGINNPTLVMAQLSTRIYDKNDIAKTFFVKPLIYNNKITTIKYVTKALRYTQASVSMPTPLECSTKNEDKICTGYQTPGVEEDLQHNLLLCGKALTQKDESLDIEKCPTAEAPPNILAYRSECVPGSKSVVISSVRPARVSVVCDTHIQQTQLLTNFPTFIETECEIKEYINETEKTILPQLQHDFFQNQKIGLVVTQSPPLIVPNPSSQLELTPVQLVFISTIGAAFASLSIFITILAIFDPQKCLGIAKTFCCCFVRLFYCFRNCCGGDNCCNCNPTNNPIIRENRKIDKNYYPSNKSLASAPPFENETQEMGKFLPRKSPAISRKSSIYDIKRVESENDVSDYRPRQQPQNPTATRTYLR